MANDAFMAYAHEIADKYGIKCQDAVRRGGSTNAGKIHLTHQAVPVLVLVFRPVMCIPTTTSAQRKISNPPLKWLLRLSAVLNDERIRHIMRQDVL